MPIVQVVIMPRTTEQKRAMAKEVTTHMPHFRLPQRSRQHNHSKCRRHLCGAAFARDKPKA